MEINFLRLIHPEIQRAKKPRSSPWNQKDAEYSHKWRQTKSRHNSNTDIGDKAVVYEFYDTGGNTAELHGFDSKTRYVLVPIFHQRLCCGSKKWRWSIRWMIFNHRDHSRVIKTFPEFWDAGRENCICSEQDHLEFLFQERGQPRGAESSERGSIGFHEEDRSPSWSTTTFEWLLLMIQQKIMLIYSLLLFMMTKKFGTRWDEVPLSMSKIPSDDILESLYKLRIRESVQLKTVLELYDMEIHQKISMPTYQKMKTMVRRSIGQNRRLRNFDARHERIESGAVVKNRKGLIGVEGGKGYCYQWKVKGQCSKGDKRSFRHERNDHAQKPTPKAATPSEPLMTRGRSVSKKRSIRGKSNHGAILRQPCRYHLKSTCTRSPCESWHPPWCRFYKTETGCKDGDECLFPHHKVDEQPNKKSEKELSFLQRKRKRRQECCGYCEKCVYTSSSSTTPTPTSSASSSQTLYLTSAPFFLRKTHRDNVNLVQKSCQVYSSVMPCMWGSGKETVWSQTLKHWMDASEIHAKRLNAKEVLTPMKGDNFMFPVAGGTVKTSGGDQKQRPSTLLRIVQNEERNKKFFEENQTGSLLQPHFKMTLHWMMRKLEMISSLSPSRGTPSQILRAQRRIISNSDQVHRRCQKHSHITCVMMEIILMITGT